ncbi:MAG: PolC-type DNA polymerase III [Firmicutes bacterium]|nr:PolC-type DNA polymerase III [Bacillota bacterium]
MRNFIESNITWSELSPHRREEFSLTIEQVSLISQARELHLDISLDFIIPYADLAKIEAEFMKEFQEINRVSFRFSYQNMRLSECEIIKLYLPHMMNSMPEYAKFTHTLDFACSHDFGNDPNEPVLISTVGEQASIILNKVAAPAMQSMLQHDFAIRRTFAFVNRKDAYKEKLEAHKSDVLAEIHRVSAESVKAEQAAKAAREAAAKNGDASGNAQKFPAGGYGNGGGFGGGQGGAPRKRGYEGPVTGNRIVGKPIGEGPVRKLKELHAESTNVIIEGSVFRTDSRALKNGKYISFIYMTDQTDSICVKMFVTAQKQADFDEHIKAGKYIRVHGDCEYDSFERMVVMMAKSIELAEKPVRMDKSERKRIELHAHTKMSQIDGLMDVADLVKTAKKWGHPAIAVTDHGVVQSFPDAAKAAKGEIKVIFGVEGYLVNDLKNPDGSIDYRTNPAYHIILLAKNQEGLKNLYKLVSYSFLHYHHKRPRMPKSVIAQHREGLIIGSACEAGEVYRAMMDGKSDEEMIKLIDFYDYLEIQPRLNNSFMVEKGLVASEEDILNYNRKIVEYGKMTDKPVVATCDAHYLEKDDYIYRNIIMAAHGFRNLDDKPKLYLRTTEEMLEEFAYLGEEEAERVVIDNPALIADMVEELRPVPKGKFPPKIEGSEERLRKNCYDKAHSIYGDPLPEIVEARLERELNSIIGNGYAVMYVAAELLVQKSLSDGYLVGSRGSVGSSFAATMGGITEVNPLPPHYICPNPDCKNSEFVDTGEYGCGVDMPDKLCPKCGTQYKKDGFSIPFETFLGFKGDKEPDIDLNFAGEYQAKAHKYVEEIFGSENVFKAGTIGTIKDKTALQYVKKYYEERGQVVNKYEMERLAIGCSGVRKTTGQHPGGIIIVPEGHEIYEFCPVMHPAEGEGRKDIITTHFDYHKIDENLLKLDILGHDVPSMIRMLQDMTGISPDDIPLSDEKVNSIFIGTEHLDIKIEDYRQKHGTFGIPEFGTSFTRQMLDDTQPKKFDALVRISGFSHGTDVWINNAQEFIKSGEATMDDAIATRDDIMNYLIQKGVPKQDSFKIMECVRKGKGLTEEQEAVMVENDVPAWYIESCKRIKYMFPRAHAVAYVMMSYRIAYFKVYYPPQFYAVHYTMKVDFFNEKVILGGMQSVLDKMDQIKKLGDEATNKEKDEYLVYEVAYEMYARGFEFLPARLGKSHATKFTVEDGKVRIPFRALGGIGESAAISFAEAYEQGPFSSIEDISVRTSVNNTNMETLREHGVLEGLPESDQLTLFSF